MNDNTSAFNALEYDEKIKKTLPYYEDFYKQIVTIHGNSKHHAKNHPAMPSGAAKPAAFVFLMMLRTAYMLISENNQPLMCKHNKFDYFLKSAVNSNNRL